MIMKKYYLTMFLVFLNIPVFAFDDGFVLGLKAHFSGAATRPHISEGDLEVMGATYMDGNVGFIIQGGADLTYIFDSQEYFGFQDNKIFGGLGWGAYLEIGQGYSGQVSGSEGVGDVFMNVFFTPVVHLGTTLKTYLLSNRLVLGFGIGGRLIADPTPTYDMYSSVPKVIPSDVGTIIVTDEMVKKMNPWGAELRFSLEYIQPVLDTMELVLGAYTSYCIYKPGYISMPEKLKTEAKKNGFDADNTKLDSFFLNSFDFGVSIGLNFKVNP